MDWIIGVYAVLIGLVVGSFLNVLIYRIPLHLSPARGFSFCPECRHRLVWPDLVPVFSYVFLKGKCRYCKAPISPRYPAVELLNALLYLGFFLQFGLGLQTLLYMISASCLLAAAFIDLDHGILPDRFNLIIGACGVLLMLFSSDLPWWHRLIGLGAVSLPLLVIALLTGGMGEGDIKLYAACGLLLGWQNAVFSFLLAAVLGAAYAVFLLLRKKATGKTAVPFGPFISFGVLISMLAGDRIIRAYLSLFTP